MFVLAPAVGFAADQSAPYPDWPAIAKTAPQKSTDQEQKSTDQQKAAEQSDSSGNEAGPIQKAKRALEDVTRHVRLELASPSLGLNG